jgi:hypothetical protein
LRGVIVRHPRIAAVAFGVAAALILFFVGGKGSMNVVGIGMAALLGGVAGAAFLFGASVRPPDSR